METAAAGPRYGIPAVFPSARADFAARIAAFTPADFALFGRVVIDHPTTPRALARRLGWRPGRVAARLAALEAAGLVTRDPSDWPEAGL
jgi:DNA-binding MarR family transcriptional regulator